MTHSRFYKVECIILKRKNWGEADRIVTVFSQEFGKFRVLAKGVRKITSRRAGHLEIFSHVALTIHKGKGNLDIVTEAEQVRRVLSDDAGLQAMSFAYYLCELVDALTPERQEHRDVFSMLVKSLEEIGQAHEISIWQDIVYSFALQILTILGFLPLQQLSIRTIHPYIESIIERRLKTTALLTRVNEGE